MRRYIRHPANIPIEINVEKQPVITSTTSNVAVGGLCFESCNNIDLGCRIQLNINIHEPFEAHGVVVWCKPNNDHFEIGVQFDDEYTKYAVRMVEQVCWIEDYRRKVLENEGRKLTTDEAAAEWISQYASRFEEMQKSVKDQDDEPE